MPCTILLQGDHDRLDLACPEDHLMVSDLGIEWQGTLTHAYEYSSCVPRMPSTALTSRVVPRAFRP